MFVLLFKSILPQSHADVNIRIIACFFNREYISYSVQYIFKKYWEEYYILCVKILLLKEMSRVLISVIAVKIEM